MSYTASIDVDNSYQVASNRGYDDLCDWFDELDWRKYRALGCIRNYGWYEPASAVSEELSKALKSDPPKGSVKNTARMLLKFIGSNDPDGVLTISQ